MKTADLRKIISDGSKDDILRDIYLDESKLAYQRERYINAIESFEDLFGQAEVSVFSAPGRSEIGGNHTDHQNGEVLACAVNVDAIAVAQATEEPVVRLVSGNRPMITVNLDSLSKAEGEQGTTVSLIKGVLRGLSNNGVSIGGFNAYVTSDVLTGAGLSSSACFETLIGTIISGLYNGMSVSPVEIAMIGQYAENEYFGKPCGLMDQTACSVGNLVHIDFANPKEPRIEEIACDLEKYGYSLCITDTKGSHANLTGEYAAITKEMREAAEMLGRKVLNGTTMQELIANASALRAKCGDRAYLRAVHFVNENKRVQKEVSALKNNDFEAFLKLVKESGDSSYKYCQNVYTDNDVHNQNVSVALAVSDTVFEDSCVSRVHGGGFAGTIQAFVKNGATAEYKSVMDGIFGEDSCNILKIRHYGGIKVL